MINQLKTVRFSYIDLNTFFNEIGNHLLIEAFSLSKTTHIMSLSEIIWHIPLLGVRHSFTNSDSTCAQIPEEIVITTAMH